MPTRVLVAEDFVAFRQLLRSILKANLDFRIVGENSNGLEAVQSAEQLQPDLILLDIGLPGLNGLRAAERIRRISPNPKIIFVSQESSVDVVKEALRLSHGYLLKTDIARELLVAIDMVMRGRQQFVSSSLTLPVAGKSIRDIDEARRNAHRSRRHDLVSCRDDASFVAHFVRFIEAALRAQNPVIVIATQEHRHSILQSLEAQGWDMAAAVREQTYTSLDVYDVLEGFMVNDSPDGSRFSEAVGSLIDKATQNARRKPCRVAACGECAPTLWAEGKAEAALQMERLWDRVAETHDIDILCGYVLGDIHKEDDPIFASICAEHSAVYS